MKDISFLKENIIAHRGLYNNIDVPENSVEAIKKAVKKNYIIELDVHLLKDNTIVVFHDDNLNRMTKVNKNLKDLNYDEIKNLNLLNAKSHIPTLEEVLKTINGKVPVIVELKYDTKVGLLEKELVKQLDNYKGKYAVMSFNPLIVRWFKKNRKDYVRGLLVSNKSKTIVEKILHNLLLLNICKPDFISCNYKMFNNKKIVKYKKNNLVLAWTIKNKKNFDKYCKYFDNLTCENMEDIWEN